MALAGGGDPGALAAGLRREVTGLGLRALAAKMLHAAVSAPDRLTDIYDSAAAGWGSGPLFAPGLRAYPPEAPSPEFWGAFWTLMETPPGQPGVYAFRTAQLAGLLPPTLNGRIAEAAWAYPGVRAAAADGIPERFNLNDLIRCPTGSLGGLFYRQVVSDGMKLEGMDRHLLGLAGLPAPLGYLNTRILQCHHLWRLTAGYKTTGLHQIAMAGFLMGQFGHHHSSLFLGLVISTVALQRPPSPEVVLDTILGGWTHGRRTPPLLATPWESLWHLPVETVRARLGVMPFESPYPADLIERAGRWSGTTP